MHSLIQQELAHTIAHDRAQSRDVARSLPGASHATPHSKSPRVRYARTWAAQQLVALRSRLGTARP